MLRQSPWRVLVVLGIVVLSIAFAAPNLFTRDQLAAAPTWLPSKQVSLGLDLQGGVHFLLEVDLTTAHADRMQSVEGAIRATFNDASPRVGYTGLSAGPEAASFELRDAADRERAIELLTGADPTLTVAIDDAGAARVSYD